MKDKRFIPREEFDAIYSRVPRLCVEVIVRTPQGIVLTKRSIEPCLGQWHIPGGTVFFAESLSEAVQRVAHDELGVTVTPGAFLGYIEYPGMLADGYKGWPVGMAFEATIAGGDIHSSEQGEELGYFKEVPENTVPDQARFLDKYVFV